METLACFVLKERLTLKADPKQHRKKSFTHHQSRSEQSAIMGGGNSTMNYRTHLDRERERYQREQRRVKRAARKAERDAWIRNNKTSPEEKKWWNIAWWPIYAWWKEKKAWEEEEWRRRRVGRLDSEGVFLGPSRPHQD